MSGIDHFELEQERQNAEMALEHAKTDLVLEKSEAHEISRYTQERDLVNQLIGRVQMASSLAKVATVTTLSDLRRIKENKLYQSLSSTQLVSHGGELVTVTTWADFCKLIGLSRETIDERLRNLNEFGEDALESMDRIGLGYRDLRKLRKLPEEDQQVIVGEVEANVGDKEAIISLIDDLAAKHTKEKAALEKQLSTQERQLEQKHKDIDAKDEQIATLQGKLDDKQAKAPTPDEEEAVFLRKLAEMESQVMFIAYHLASANLQNATTRAKMKAAHMAEFMEVYGRTMLYELMHTFHELWGGNVPGDGEVQDAQNRLKDAIEKLEDGLPTDTKDLN